MCAVNAAIDAQRALELPVRMGIATGEAELRHAFALGPTPNKLPIESKRVALDGLDHLDVGASGHSDRAVPQDPLHGGGLHATGGT